MLSDIELETSRLLFETEKEILTMELKEILEKTIKIENILRNNIAPVVDSYTPCASIVLPPKKRMKRGT
jgi:transcription antitermination factor NusA-like protein